VYRPPADDQVRDRRAAKQATKQPAKTLAGKGVMTRSQAKRAASAIENREGSPEREEEPIDESLCAPPEREPIGYDREPPEKYREAEGEVRLENVDHQPHFTNESRGMASEDLADLAPFAYYFSPGWYQTGMQYVSDIRRTWALGLACKTHLFDRYYQCRCPSTFAMRWQTSAWLKPFGSWRRNACSTSKSPSSRTSSTLLLATVCVV
jgi:hypothetical protein